MSEEWGPWIDHDGKGCPCVGQFFHGELDIRSYRDENPRVSVLSNGKEVMGFAGGGASWFWDGWPEPKIIRYRIRKPRALSQLQQMIRELEGEPV